MHKKKQTADDYCSKSLTLFGILAEKRREGPMKRESVRWSMAPLHHWCFQPPEAWVAAEIFYKRLASLISEKKDQSYAVTMGLIRCGISFSLIRSEVMCVRGSRSSYHHPISPASQPADLVAREGRVPRW